MGNTADKFEFAAPIPSARSQPKADANLFEDQLKNCPLILVSLAPTFR